MNGVSSLALSLVFGTRLGMAMIGLAAGYAAGELHGRSATSAGYQAASAAAEAGDLRKQLAATQAIAKAASERAVRSEAAKSIMREKVDAYSATLHGSGPCTLDRGARLRLCDLAGLPGCTSAPASRPGRPPNPDPAGGAGSK